MFKVKCLLRFEGRPRDIYEPSVKATLVQVLFDEPFCGIVLFPAANNCRNALHMALTFRKSFLICQNVNIKGLLDERLMVHVL